MIRFLKAMADAIARLFANKGARMTMVVSILIYAVIYPQPYMSEVVRDVPIAVIDQDGSSASRQLRRSVDAADSVAVAAVVGSMAEAEALFYDRKTFGMLVIPPNFEQDLLDGRPAPVAVFGDGSYFTIYGAIASAISTATQQLGTEVRFARLTSLGIDTPTASALVAPVQIASVPLFNPHGGFGSYLIPAAFVLIIQQTLLMGIGIMHAGRRPRPGIARLATPTAYVALYSVWIAATQILLPRVYGLPAFGDPLVLFAVAIPFLVAVTAMGFALIQLIPTREGMIFFLVVQGMPLFFLTGVAWPVEAMPDLVRWVTLAIPSTSALAAIVRVDQMGVPLELVLPEIKLQLMLALIYSVIGVTLAHIRGWPIRWTGPASRRSQEM